ncbi:OLC1v1018770C1 [Oldenlandia corymbosa var. corymbosa]|uniref:Germin-like protein n=1 Tax=Oldenlandia corymbosa var. corymbosa TaxID=529605 RepID=A0AAV1ECH2_OLDCO|nr:OLC1v1018770C1 [Oldenlandia corymbosa var. corymbosa]
MIMKLLLLIFCSFLTAFLIIFPKSCLQAAEIENLQDTCPTDHMQSVFINGLPCKNPATVTASDFKSSLLNEKGKLDDVFRSSTNLVTASEFPGLNTLGLSTARTDLEVDGMVPPHSHPRSSEMIFVGAGIVNVGFVDTNNKLFQQVLRPGDVFVFPKGLLHYCLNNGFEDATIYSVLNSQNPGIVSILGSRFAPSDDRHRELMQKIKERLVSFSKLDAERLDNVTLF